MNCINRRTMAYAATLALVFIWSIPGTIALRTVLLLSALALATWSIRSGSSLAGQRLPRAPLVALALLSVWLFAQAVFISREPYWALGELRGQWLTALAAFALGAMMSKLDGEKSPAGGYLLWTGIALVFSSQTAIAVGQSLGHWIMHGEMLRGLVPLTGGKLEMSYIVNILLAILTVDLYFRATAHRQLLRIPVSANLACVVLGLLTNYLASSRNGILGTVFLALSATFLFLVNGRDKLGNRKTFATVLALFAGITVFSVASYRSDPRWTAFAETARIAINLDGSQAWLDPDHIPMPLLSNGAPVEASAYLRVAWISAGIRLAQGVPYGVGYGRNAFLRGLKRLGYEPKLGHAHSGVVDLLAGGGLPAVALWFVFAATLVVVGWRSYTKRSNPLGLLLILLVSGFTGRMLIESVSRDHMLQIFFFLVGALLVGSASPLWRDDAKQKGPAVA